MSIRYHIVLPDQQRVELSRLADRMGSSTASLVRIAIQQLLDLRELRLPRPIRWMEKPRNDDPANRDIIRRIRAGHARALGDSTPFRAPLHAEVFVKPHGAPTRAAAAAGYKSNTRANLSKHAHDLLHDPMRSEKVIAAVAEESRKIIRAGHPEAVGALFEVIRDRSHEDRVRAIAMILERTASVQTHHSISVTHKHIGADQEALEEFMAAKALGATPEKLRELFGGNAISRLEVLEAKKESSF